MSLYPKKCAVPEHSYRVPFARARVVRPGTDVTVVAIAAMVDRSLAAADQVETEGISVEVVDPRTLSPLDESTILESVQKTHRLLVIDESPPRCSIASDVAGLVAQHMPGELSRGVRLLTCPHSPVPFAPSLEARYVPSVERAVEAIGELCAD
jgi:pyruvate dehydrogenase E1 component beta subunit